MHIPDALADPEYTFSGPQVGGFRSLLGVPLIRDGSVTGVFVLARPTVKPFNQREIELVQTFSDQALIALENVRLFDEVQARNREVTEALEQQTATGEILRVIAASPTDIQPVLQVVAESAARFCDTHDAVILLPQDGMGSPSRRTTAPSRWTLLARYCRSHATGSPVAPLSTARRCMFTICTLPARNFLSANPWPSSRVIGPLPPRR